MLIAFSGFGSRGHPGSQLSEEKSRSAFRSVSSSPQPPPSDGSGCGKEATWTRRNQDDERPERRTCSAGSRRGSIGVPRSSRAYESRRSRRPDAGMQRSPTGSSQRSSPFRLSNVTAPAKDLWKQPDLPSFRSGRKFSGIPQRHPLLIPNVNRRCPCPSPQVFHRLFDRKPASPSTGGCRDPGKDDRPAFILATEAIKPFSRNVCAVEAADQITSSSSTIRGPRRRLPSKRVSGSVRLWKDHIPPAMRTPTR